MPNIFGKNYNRRELLDLIGDVSQVANARYAELKEGSDRGAALIAVYNS